MVNDPRCEWSQSGVMQVFDVLEKEMKKCTVVNTSRIVVVGGWCLCGVRVGHSYVCGA